MSILAGLASCSSSYIMICDQAQARVVLLDAKADWSNAEAVVWQWQAADSPAIASDQQKWFEHPTDAKPVLGGDFALITASGGGVALVRLVDKAAIFHAHPGGNPHSAEILPDGKLVTASSTGGVLKLWSLVRRQEPLQVVPLFDAHGVCWDPNFNLLWAIGRDELVSFVYDQTQTDPTLKENSRHRLPDPGGHDLQRSSDGESLILSTLHGVWTFLPESGEFSAYPGLDSTAEVKSISVALGKAQSSAPTIWLQAEQRWWSDTVYTSEPETRYLMPDAKIYKARWWFFRDTPHTQQTHFTFSFGFGGILGLDPE